jgi:predicted nucleotide-binding protein (sugar kinase/HSP70/actin superfamily)
MNGGEGDMLIGKSLWIHNKKKAHMICELSPYSCMPKHHEHRRDGGRDRQTSRHALTRRLKSRAIAEIHALSRCQMILTEAKRRAQNEYEEALERTGSPTEKARALLDKYPEMKSHLSPTTWRRGRYRRKNGIASGREAAQ